jgi:hypothetical protein
MRLLNGLGVEDEHLVSWDAPIGIAVAIESAAGGVEFDESGRSHVIASWRPRTARSGRRPRRDEDRCGGRGC